MNLRLISFFILGLVFCMLPYDGFAEEREPLPCLNKDFSIVVHIVRDTLGSAGVAEQEILDALNEVNDYYSDICVSFSVCEFRYIDNFQYDNLVFSEEWSQLLTTYHQANRINMFFVTNIDEDPSICGKADLGGISSMQGTGVAIVKSCAEVGTIAHELGHFFGLMHTFEGSGVELADGSNCDTFGDNICDTPADPYNEDDPVEMYVNDNCEFIYNGLDANGDYYDPMVGNIMSYYPCKCGFTYEQYLVMANSYLNSNPKMW